MEIQNTDPGSWYVQSMPKTSDSSLLGIIYNRICFFSHSSFPGIKRKGNLPIKITTSRTKTYSFSISAFDAFEVGIINTKLN